MFVLITETVTTVRKLLYSARQPDTLYLLTFQSRHKSGLRHR